jgi:hypothetical protein
MFTTIVMFLAAFGVTAAGLILVPGLRTVRPSMRFVASAFLFVVLSAGVSALVTSTRHSGTGTVREFGWPKPFYFRWTSWQQAGDAQQDLNLLYFIGNGLFWAGALLSIWFLYRIARHLRRGN